MLSYIWCNKELKHSSYSISGASGENRTLVPSLENLYTNRCTTLAYLNSLRNAEELWGGKSELNRRPSGPQSDALTDWAIPTKL